ncbi:MAG: gamma-glutamyl-gamma-aminobutyrate hydrolase family protein [Oscillospiraceae bacterium]|nr:gamma-glutamyl-gamma-aminobutyrate hydrolase family protein [Oscillospiraceae bacterium]
MKPIIGIFPSFDEENKRVYLNKQYLDEIIRFGGIPFIIPLSSDQKTIYEIIRNIDGIILSGGYDIDPKYYGQENSGKSVNISEITDECENAVIRLALEADIPVLGICRGMQALETASQPAVIPTRPANAAL